MCPDCFTNRDFGRVQCASFSYASRRFPLPKVVGSKSQSEDGEDQFPVDENGESAEGVSGITWDNFVFTKIIRP